MAELLRQHSVDPDDFTARTITKTMVDSADLVLTATRDHRGDVVDHVPGAVRRTFTLREFARLAGEVDPAVLAEQAGPDARPAERLATLIPLAAARRQRVAAELDDVVDPYRRSEEVYRESFEQLIDAARRIVQVVLGLPGETR